MYSKTVSLTANTEQIINFEKPDSSNEKITFNDFIVYNTSNVNVYCNVNGTAAVEGEGSVVIPSKSGRGLGVRGESLHLICSSSAKVEVQGVL